MKHLKNRNILIVILVLIGVGGVLLELISKERNISPLITSKDLTKPGIEYRALPKNTANTIHKISQANGDTQTLTGEELYKQNCAVCHGMDRKGNPPAIPSLVDVGRRLDEKSILNLLKTGRNGMPSFAHLPSDQRRAIVDFLMGKKTKVQVESLTSKQKGEQLFKANCALCHKATPDDPTPPGQRNYGRRPPVLGGINKALAFNHFERILNRGPFYMPSFYEMPSEDKKAIYEYLSDLPYTPGQIGRCGGGKCGTGRKCGGGKCR